LEKLELDKTCRHNLKIIKGNFILIKIKNIEEIFFAVSRYWGSLNSSLKRIEPIYAMHTGVAISDINWVWNEKPLKKDDAQAITQIKEYYKNLNLRFWWWVYPRGQSPETARMLQDAGLRLIAKVPCMAADLNNSLSDAKFSENISVIEVKDKSDLFFWKDVSFHGFEMPQRAREQYDTFVASFNLGGQSPQRLFLACLDGKPVATSLLFTHGKSAGIYYVSTLPDYRNKGCGLSITQAAMQAGFKDIILQATPSGEKVYTRAGFKEYCRAEIYKL
jgi:GNAT superfamily N-acetyltransferase